MTELDTRTEIKEHLGAAMNEIFSALDTLKASQERLQEMLADLRLVDKIAEDGTNNELRDECSGLFYWADSFYIGDPWRWIIGENCAEYGEGSELKQNFENILIALSTVDELKDELEDDDDATDDDDVPAQAVDGPDAA